MKSTANNVSYVHTYTHAHTHTVDTRGISSKNLHANDDYPLPYSASTQLMKYKAKCTEFNSRGFGAAGLPPLAFSHMNRNWILNTLQGETLFQTVSELDEFENVDERGGTRNRYGPGFSLLKFPKRSMDVVFTSDDEEEQSMEVDIESQGLDEYSMEDQMDMMDISSSILPEQEELGSMSEQSGVPPRKKRKGLEHGMVMVPSSQVKRSSGGKGRARYRMKNRAG